MKRIASAKVIGKGEKPCNGCHQVKPFAEFYVRPTFGTLDKPAVEPGHLVSECIACMKERGKTPKRLEPWESRVPTEQIAIDYLTSKGIWTTTGKMTNAPDVDLACLGAVWVEVKHCHVRHRGYTSTFMFNMTPSQQKRGFLAHVVMLICEYDDGRLTYHLLPASHPVFYKNDGKSMKSAVSHTVGKRKASTRGKGYKHQITQQLMDEWQDDVGLIWSWMVRIREALVAGEKPEYGKPFAKTYTPNYIVGEAVA